MKVICILETNEENLKEKGTSFEEEIKSLEKSGITLKYVAKASVNEEYEYAPFIYNTETNEYILMRHPVENELLCRNRTQELLKEGIVSSSYDTGRVQLRKRLRMDCSGEWEKIEDYTLTE